MFAWGVQHELTEAEKVAALRLVSPLAAGRCPNIPEGKVVLPVAVTVAILFGTVTFAWIGLACSWIGTAWHGWADWGFRAFTNVGVVLDDLFKQNDVHAMPGD